MIPKRTRPWSTTVDNFWATLLPVVIGGLVSSLAVYFGFQLDRKAQREDRADAATATLMNALTQYNADREVHIRWGQFGIHREEPQPRPADSDAVSVAGQLLIMATRGKDRNVARQFLAAWRSIVKGDDDVTGAVRHLAFAIAAWRTGE